MGDDSDKFAAVQSLQRRSSLLRKTSVEDITKLPRLPAPVLRELERAAIQAMDVLGKVHLPPVPVELMPVEPEVVSPCGERMGAMLAGARKMRQKSLKSLADSRQKS